MIPEDPTFRYKKGTTSLKTTKRSAFIITFLLILIMSCSMTFAASNTVSHPEIVRRSSLKGTNILSAAKSTGAKMTRLKVRYAHRPDQSCLRKINLYNLKRSSARYAKCTDFISYTLQSLRLMSKDRGIWSNGHGDIVARYIDKDGMHVTSNADSKISAELKEQLLRNFSILKSYKAPSKKTYQFYGIRVSKVKGLKPGDIVFMRKTKEDRINASIHMMIYATGKGADKKWYNGGSKAVNSSGYISIGSSPRKYIDYNDWYVTSVLRLK